MAKYNEILIIDADQRVATTVAKILNRNYRIHAALDGRKALHFLESNKPQLIVVDVELPDINGFEICKHIKQHPEMSDIPIIVLTRKDDLDSRLTGLQLGVTEYLSKPLHRAELKIRIQNILKQQAELTREKVQPKHVEEKLVSLLKFIKSRDNHTLRPSPDATRQLGYSYPGLEKLINADNGFTDLDYLEDISENDSISKTFNKDNKELIYLEHLTEKRALSRKIHDTVHLCPYCEHHDINFREICPQCSSIDIELVDLIHHFRCAYIGPEHEFRQGVDYVCPKCSHTLRHIGVDYEKPARSFQCHQCDHVFSEPSIDCLSLFCGKSFDVEKSMTRHIYAYTLTDVGQLAIENGHIDEATFEHAFWDLQLELYTMPFLHQQVKLEIKRAERYSRPFSIMLIQLNNMDDLNKKYGRIVLLGLLRELGKIINEGTRITDIPARQAESELLFMLPETRIEDARVIADRIRKNAERFKYSLMLNICLVEYPRSGNMFDDLFAGLTVAMSRCIEKGGNKTISFIRE